MEVKYSRDAIKFLSKLNKKTINRIREAISKLTLNTPLGDIAIMKGYSDGRKRLRVGDFRVIFRYDKQQQIEVLLIVDIGNRGDVYR